MLSALLPRRLFVTAKIEELPEFVGIQLEDVNQAGNFGDLPIHAACIRGGAEEIAALVHGGADINAPGETGNTPLHHAVGQGHIAVVKVLLEYGACRGKKNNLAMTAFEQSKLSGRNDIANILAED